MHTYIALTLATFWAWETVRYAAQRWGGAYYDLSRAVHPLVVAALPLAVLWPDWIDALAVAAVVGLLHLAVERFLGLSTSSAVTFPGRRRRNLPPLP